MRETVTHILYNAVENAYLECKKTYPGAYALASLVDECLEEVGIRLLDEYGDE